jgi:hypothetical protein
MTIEELEEKLHRVKVILLQATAAAGDLATEARAQAFELDRIRAQAVRDLMEKPQGEAKP